MDVHPNNGLTLNEQEVEQVYAYAYAQYKGGNVEEAAEAFQLLCIRRPLESRFWFGFGAALQERQSYEGALQAWAMTSLLNPKDPMAHFHAAECYLSLGENKEALKALKIAKEFAKDTSLENKIDLLFQQWSPHL